MSSAGSESRTARGNAAPTSTNTFLYGQGVFLEQLFINQETSDYALYGGKFDPTFGIASAKHLDFKRTDGLTICPVTFAELAPVFAGDTTAQKEFLFNLGVVWPADWTQADSEESHRAWHRYVIARRATKVSPMTALRTE